LHLVKRLRGGGGAIMVEGVDQKITYVDTQLDGNVEDLRREVFDKFGIPMEEQVLTFEGREMLDG
jgi:hypothetical protein